MSSIYSPNYEVDALISPVFKTLQNVFSNAMPSINDSKHTIRRVTRNSVNKAYDKNMDDQSSSPKKDSIATPCKPFPRGASESEKNDYLYNEFHHKIDYMYSEFHRLNTVLKELIELRKQNEEKDKRIQSLEERVEALEQYSRQDNILINGFKPTPRSYAGAVGSEHAIDNYENANDDSKENLEDQIVNFLKSRDIPIDKNDISTCHTLPTKDRTKIKPIVVRFTTRKAKVAVLRHGKNLKVPVGSDEPNVFVIEHLTSKNAIIAKHARYLRKQRKITSTWKRNCKIFVKAEMNGAVRVIQVNKLDDLIQFE